MKGGLVEAIDVKRFLINAVQMSAAVTVGLLLSPVVLSTRHMVLHFVHHH